MSAHVTAIVVVHDSAAKVPACLAALARAGVSVIVVDNASEDDSARVAESYGARVLRNAKNEGFGRAMNRGMIAADTEFALLVNPDLVLEDDAVQALLAAAAQWPDAAIFAPRIIEPDGRVFFADQSLLAKSPLHNRQRVHWTPEGDCCTPFLSGACWLVRRAMVLSLGGFDDNIFLFYEDDDLCRRVLDAGHALIHVHQAIARHERGASAAPKRGRIFKARRHLAWSRAYISQKYGLKSPIGETLLTNGPKALLALLMLNRSRFERYGGSVQGCFDFMRGRSALAVEGLQQPD